MSQSPEYDTEIHELIATNLRHFRQLKSLSQAQLAAMAKLSAGYIAQIELGAKYPGADVLEKLCAALDVRPYQFYTSGEDIAKLHNKDKKLYDFSVRITELILSEAQIIAEERLNALEQAEKKPKRPPLLNKP